jgi:hypothetical protein
VDFKNTATAVKDFTGGMAVITHLKDNPNTRNKIFCQNTHVGNS